MITRLITTTLVLTYLACVAVRAQEPQDLRPGVVRIYNAKRDEQGTGFIVRIRGGKAYVISAAHVVEGGRDHEVYLFNRPNEPLKGRVIDMEAGEPFGLALLEINVDEGLIPGLKELELGSASGLRGGESVQVIGFPARTTQWTILPAAVARIEGREIVFAGSIQGGNSGGPVLLDGKVVGVVVERNESESLSYAAQAESVVQYVKGIEEMLFSAVDSALREEGRDAIYVTRIINPPSGQGRQKATVWLAASGRQTYIVDSITIEHIRGGATSMGSGARPPDAHYSFSFAYGSKETHALNPALSLDPKDPREVSFTLGLGPEGRFPSVGGDVYAYIHYHTSKGVTGTLRLKEPSPEGKRLAKMLGADVKADGLVVTARGIQRGLDEESSEPLLVYEPLSLPRGFYLPDPELPKPVPRVKLTQERLALNSTVGKKGIVPEIVKLLNLDNMLAFDLCAGLQSPLCLAELTKSGKSVEFRARALRSLTLGHLIKPTGDLAEYILSSEVAKEYSYAFDEAGTALAFHPAGRWTQALLLLAGHDPDLISRLYMRRADLAEPERKLLEDICSRQFDAPFPEKAAMLYLLWRGHPKSSIKKRLKSLPPSLLNDYDASRYKNYRERLRQDLFSVVAKKRTEP